MSFKAQSLLKSELKEKASDNLSDLLFDNHPLPLLIATSANIITDVNDAAAELLGYTLKQIKGRSLNEIINGYLPANGIATRLYSVACNKAIKEIRINERSFTYNSNSGKLLFITDVTNLNKLREGLSFRIELEKLLILISNTFINVQHDKIDEKINHALELIGKFSDADRCYMFRFRNSGMYISNTHEWCAPEIQPSVGTIENIAAGKLSWWQTKIYNNEYLYIEDFSKLPAEAAAEKGYPASAGVKSVIAVPLCYKGNILGFIGFDFVKDYKTWDDENLQLLQFTGTTIANVIVRKETDDEHRKKSLLLQETEEKYESVVNNIQEVFFQTDTEGHWVFLSPTWKEITGYSVEECIGQKIWHFIHPDDQAAVAGLFVPQKETKQIEGRRELKYISKSGESRWCDVFVQFAFNNNGNVKGTFGTISDITVRRKTQATLELRNKAINAVRNGMVITDPSLPDNPIIFCNPAFEKITGYTFEEVAGKNARILQGPDSDPKTIAILREAVKNGTHCNVILKNYRKDGNPFWNHISISPIRDSEGKLINFVGIQLDITERVKVETALSLSERKYRSVVESIKEVIFHTDLQGNWMYLNPAWEEITGYTVEESIEKHSIDYVHPEDKEKHEELFKLLINREKEFSRHTIRYITKNGSFRYIEFFARLTFDDNDNITGTAGTLNDITEGVKAEEDIKAALEKEKELSELKSRFISTVSHEFRTPLTTILASSELLQRYNEKWDNIKKISTLERIQESVEYMNNLITDVLTLNKAEAGAAKFNPRLMNIISLCGTIAHEVQLSAEAKHKLIFEHKNESIEAMFDEKLIRQICENLLMNAIKYSPKGGPIIFSVEEEKKSIIISVQDYGIGIPEEDQVKLFQPFFRGNNVEQISGSGLGLSILQKAVELHKGVVLFASEINKGTTFTIKIPMVIS